MIRPQQAQTANEPLITRVDLRFGEMFRNRPVPSDDRATVYLDRHGRYHHMTEQVPIGGIAGHRALFLVNTSVFTRDFQFKLPSREQAYFFTAKVVVRWRITDPVEAAKTNLVDALPILRYHVERALRDVSAGFPIEDGAGAERAMAAAFAGTRGRQPFAQGVSVVDCDAALTLDAATTAYVRKRTEDARTHEINKDGLVRSGIEQIAQQRLETLRSKHELELEKLKQEHQLQLESQRMEFYGGAIARDPNNAIGLMLSNSPDRAADVLAMLVKQRQLELDDARELLETMLKHGLVNRSDIAGIMDQATSVITRRAGGGAPLKLDLDAVAAGLPPSASSPSAPGPGAPEEPLTAEVVADSSKLLFKPLDFDDDDDDDEL
ncbi:hypothetical protein [Saccharothrix coeruleofusca]|uniref:Uncharacterized protein n=1 Tax=Saccharothrix coeruleofusca TaxID=33919 RepID=A0A918ALE4_9PSEU|nr:hypothetical protein [Saccharothrix coeruleofusca]MBP2333917.1 hypothetical protein [Saccharothrix coeruleofusca]GGP44771.1 hypothetical protein GCM10010185_15640 [Saccharothrix coeruleofusca]